LRDQVLVHFAPDSLMFRYGLVNRVALLRQYDA